MLKDISQTLSPVVSVAPAAARTTSTNGTGVDLRGYQAAMVTFTPAAITDGTHTPKLQESDVLGSGYTDVAAGDLVGTLSALAANTVQTVGYRGTKRYLRAVVTVTGSPSTGGIYSAVVLRGYPQVAPTA